MCINREVEEKQEQIENYKRLIDEYGRGRWYWKYRRRLDDLIAELEVLKSKNLGP